MTYGPAPYTGARYPLAPAVELAGNWCRLAAAMGVDSRVLHRLHNAGGFPPHWADRAAVALRLHPETVWPSWSEDGLTERDRVFVERGWRQAWLYANA